MQIVFQDPYSSIDPNKTIGWLVEEPLRIHGIGKTKQERDEKVSQVLKAVGLDESYRKMCIRDSLLQFHRPCGIAKAEQASAGGVSAQFWQGKRRKPKCLKYLCLQKRKYPQGLMPLMGIHYGAGDRT